MFAKVARFIKNRKELTEDKLEELEEIVMDSSKAQAILDASKSSMGMWNTRLVVMMRPLMRDCLCHFVCTKQVHLEVMILTCTWQILGLNLSQDTGCSDEIILWFSSVPAGRHFDLQNPSYVVNLI